MLTNLEPLLVPREYPRIDVLVYIIGYHTASKWAGYQNIILGFST
jgi:hypothetical protein